MHTLCRARTLGFDSESLRKRKIGFTNDSESSNQQTAEAHGYVWLDYLSLSICISQHRDAAEAAVAAGGAGAPVDWSKVLSGLGGADEDTEVAIEGVIVWSLLEMMVTMRSFGDTAADALVVPAAALSVLGTLPLHVAEALQKEASAEQVREHLSFLVPFDTKR